MSLNIKNETVHRLVRELSERTGLSQTSAVEDAVRRRLSELDTQSTAEVAERAARIMELAAEIRAGYSDEELRRIRNADDELYDELGLPK